MIGVIVNHGTGGSPQSNWFPWLAAELGALGCRVVVPQYPTPEGQRLDNWLEVFEREAGPCTSKTILVGHSAGAAFMLRVIERLAAPVKASFFTAGFARLLNNPEFDPLIESFVAEPFNWERIRQNAGQAVVYHGDNDPYVPLALGQEIAEELGAQFVMVPGGGHLNAAFGFTTFDLLLCSIKDTL
ncbi:MAG TPA: alpha/beta fold hydrolase [Oligoflexia bacterium]|nr:alpha/beta fold hydrolase [Oligoflexia bacterium]